MEESLVAGHEGLIYTDSDTSIKYGVNITTHLRGPDLSPSAGKFLS
jgi:hypothetical protein